MPSWQKTKIEKMQFAAVIVIYRPKIKDLAALIESIREQVDTVYIMNNGASGEVERFLEAQGVQVFDMQGNRGIAMALNTAAAQAKKSGLDFLVTFDQDSVAKPGHVQGLYQCWREKQNQGVAVGGVGPGFYDTRSGQDFQYPFYRGRGLRVEKIYPSDAGGIVETDILITSGMLVSVDVILKNEFREELFIDFVDTEWCFRINQRGYQNFGCFNVSMQHELSEAAPKKMAGMTLLKYSPLRRYYFFRNCCYVLAKPYTPWAFKLRMGVSMLIRLATLWKIDENPGASLKMSLSGIWDAIRGRMGKLNA